MSTSDATQLLTDLHSPNTTLTRKEKCVIDLTQGWALARSNSTPILSRIDPFRREKGKPIATQKMLFDGVMKFFDLPSAKKLDATQEKEHKKLVKGLTNELEMKVWPTLLEHLPDIKEERQIALLSRFKDIFIPGFKRYGKEAAMEHLAACAATLNGVLPRLPVRPDRTEVVATIQSIVSAITSISSEDSSEYTPRNYAPGMGHDQLAPILKKISEVRAKSDTSTPMSEITSHPVISDALLFLHETVLRHYEDNVVQHQINQNIRHMRSRNLNQIHIDNLQAELDKARKLLKTNQEKLDAGNQLLTTLKSTASKAREEMERSGEVQQPV